MTRSVEVWPRRNNPPISFYSDEWEKEATGVAEKEYAKNLYLRCSIDCLRHVDGRVMLRGIVVKIYNNKPLSYKCIVGPYISGYNSVADIYEVLENDLHYLMGQSYGRYIIKMAFQNLCDNMKPEQV